MVTRRPGVELALETQHGQRQTAADRLGHDDDVGFDPRMFEGKHLAGTAKAGLHFIQNQQNAVLARDFANLAQPCCRCRIDTALALHRFQNHRRRQRHTAFHVLDELGEVVTQRFGPGLAANAQRATIFMGIRQELHTGHQISDGVFWRSVAGQRQGSVGHAVVGAGKADDVMATGGGLGQFDRGFDRVGPGRTAKLQAVIAPLSWQQTQQRFAESVLDRSGQIKGVHGHARGQKAVETGHDGFVIVTQCQCSGSGQTIQVRGALDIRDPHAMCLGDRQWQLAGVTPYIRFKLALPVQIVGIGFLRRSRVQ
ncbi:Uncharacterized protein ALO91_05860 [Pseudomonas syringae pv. aceris]|uniref:Uncharacterized protein n=1 Tax=Pseudomonas syringae pv. aceris TaxID=199198 RepID=A0A0P9HRX1_PSESX|nr:Uncharacterized protein ALO91_05860 [Pseudomonas syringae pv. aceris]